MKRKTCNVTGASLVENDENVADRVTETWSRVSFFITRRWKFLLDILNKFEESILIWNITNLFLQLLLIRPCFLRE